MPTKVADLSVELFREFVREVAMKTLGVQLGHADKGLELRPAFAVEAECTLAAVIEGAKSMPAEIIVARPSLTW